MFHYKQIEVTFPVTDLFPIIYSYSIVIDIFPSILMFIYIYNHIDIFLSMPVFQNILIVILKITIYYSIERHVGL